MLAAQPETRMKPPEDSRMEELWHILRTRFESNIEDHEERFA